MKPIVLGVPSDPPHVDHRAFLGWSAYGWPRFAGADWIAGVCVGGCALPVFLQCWWLPLSWWSCKSLGCWSCAILELLFGVRYKDFPAQRNSLLKKAWCPQPHPPSAHTVILQYGYFVAFIIIWPQSVLMHCSSTHSLFSFLAYFPCDKAKPGLALITQIHPPPSFHHSSWSRSLCCITASARES